MFIRGDTKLESAIKAARKLHPTVRAPQFGIDLVRGSKGNKYLVSCDRAGAGRKAVECECPTRDGVACQDGVAALPLHVWIAGSRRAH